MIYIKLNENNVVTMAGEVANQSMLDDGYVQYLGEIPAIHEYQYYEMNGGVLVASNDNVEYATEISKQIQLILDDKAVELRYDNMMSARALAGLSLVGTETSEQVAIHLDAIKLARWYLACWGKATEIENDVIAGNIPRPTVQEVIDQLPAYV